MSAAAVMNAQLEGVVLAGDVAEAASVSFGDLPLYERAEQALGQASTLVAAVIELRERLALARLDSADRWDIGEDLYKEAGRLQAFALEVMMGVQP